MRTLIWFIYFWVYLVLLYPKLWQAKGFTKQGLAAEHDHVVAVEVNKWALSLLRLAGVTVRVQGTENIPENVCIFVANHQGNFDIPILLSHLDAPHSLVAKDELKKLPILRDWMTELGCVFLDRDNVRRSMEAINQAIAKVNEGSKMIIFPEGTRSKGGPVGEFKSGAFRIAGKTRAPIVPIAISGSYKAMEGNRNFIRPAEVLVKVLPAVDISELSKEDLRLLPQRIRDIICENLE